MPNKPTVDFDHFSEDYAKNWPEKISKLHKECPVAWTNAFDGFWVLADYEAVKTAAEEYETFSSYNDVENERRGEKGIMIPPLQYRITLNEQDPPVSQKYRMLEAPYFTPKYLPRYKELAQRHADECIDKVVDKGLLDIVADYAVPVPVKTALAVVGVDPAKWEKFAMPVRKIAYLPGTHPDYPLAELANIQQDLISLVEDRRKNPKDDLASRVSNGQIDGEPISIEVATGLLLTLTTGAFDTATSLLCHALDWLGDKPDVRRRLLEDSDLFDNAIEEFLRVFPPTHGTARNVVQNAELCGQKLQPGERVLLSWASANHDPKKFECPFEVRIDRSNAKDHMAFGGGSHRCLGAPLARIEIRVALETVLRRLPDYKIDKCGVKRFPTSGLIDGYFNLPATFTPSS
jgi:cytochrome P450